MALAFQEDHMQPQGKISAQFWGIHRYMWALKLERCYTKHFILTYYTLLMAGWLFSRCLIHMGSCYWLEVSCMTSASIEKTIHLSCHQCAEQNYNLMMATENVARFKCIWELYWLTDSIGHHPSWKANGHSVKKNSLPFMEPRGSLLHSQEPAIGPCHESHVSSPRLPTLFPWDMF